MMGHRASLGTLEPKDVQQPGNRLHAIFMVYGSEAILPTDLDYGAPRVKAYNE